MWLNPWRKYRESKSTNDGKEIGKFIKTLVTKIPEVKCKSIKKKKEKINTKEMKTEFRKEKKN